MNRYIPNQHGAWVMLILPFLFGLVAFGGHSLHILLFISWLLLYLLSFPLLQWIKTGKAYKYRQPALVYAGLSIPVLSLLLIYQPDLIGYGIFLGICFVLNMYYARTRNERALINDIIAIVMFCSFIYPVMYIGRTTDWQLATTLFLIAVLYFVGTALYVKTMLRERGNVHYYIGSIFYHIVICGLVSWMNIGLIISFALLLLRSIILPHFNLKSKHVGIIEICFAVVLYISITILYS
ncbi:hypothetical protein PaeCFBP13512_05235 [Paenibacillus sp. CFBP13512]|uniref:YwiC-like family protein n=1 Tax=Paenibacillus sp. CFBP13512 TaxID=2184007 RepID=UPI0010BFF259|nr:YwiC-like family protein [Paenibacillus sp. CFBP13512]TKJ92758.1 hypothetical protein PaeCFBP13512_05235 [Paenibacillus sp. CFBP13512]